jgi:hypothetical protein
LGEGLDIFRLVTIAAGGKMKPSGNFSLTKISLALSIWEFNREGLGRFDCRFQWFGGIILAEGLQN